MLPEMVFIQFWLRFPTEKFKKLGELALHFDGAALDFGTLPGNAGTIFRRFKKKTYTIQAYF